MAPPKGSQYAKGHGYGRTPSYSMEEQAEALDIWSKKDDSLYLGEFCCEQDICPEYISRWAVSSDIFSQALKKAKLRIATKLRKRVHNNTYNYGLFMREIGMYDYFLYEFEKEQKLFDIECKKKIEKVDEENFIREMRRAIVEKECDKLESGEDSI